MSCKSASACEAVGQFTSGGASKTLAERWNGSNWAIQATPNAGGATNSVLGGVSCPSASACEAVGHGSTGTSSVALAEVWNGTNWAVQTAPNGSGSVNELEGVSCTAASACTATGNGLAERWNGTKWALQTLASPHGDTPADLSRVSCTAANACTAVGDFVNASNKEVPLAERWNGTNWSAQNVPAPSGSSSGFSSVSCLTTAFTTGCNAVGFVMKNGIGLPMSESWNGTTWVVKPAQSPDPNVTRSTMSSVSCSSLTTCMGVGFYETSGGVDAPLGELYS